MNKRFLSGWIQKLQLRELKQSGFSTAALLLAAVLLLVCGTAFAAKNPLNTIAADGFDVKSGAIKTEPCNEGGNDICSIHDGDYVIYKGYDFDSGVAAPDGNILIASCSCTFAGYTGAPETSNVSAIADGKQPWKVLKLGTLPDAPVSRDHVWYEGPNFGTALYYELKNDTLYFYGGFHDYYIGMMRVQIFSQSRLFHPQRAHARQDQLPAENLRQTQNTKVAL
jgi:hypothetical protein